MYLYLVDGIKASKWVKRYPCRGYRRLLVAMVIPVVLRSFLYTSYAFGDLVILRIDSW
jgi:hypothetical protein